MTIIGRYLDGKEVHIIDRSLEKGNNSIIDHLVRDCVRRRKLAKNLGYQIDALLLWIVHFTYVMSKQSLLENEETKLIIVKFLLIQFLFS